MPISIEDRIKQQEEKLKQLKTKKAKIEAAQRRATAQKNEAEETRRKILIGSFFLARMEENEDMKHNILSQLETYLTRDHDRVLFGLTAREPKPTNPAPSIADMPSAMESV